VGHPAGQSANGIHFLCLLQFRLQPASLGDVAEGGDEMRDFRAAVSLRGEDVLDNSGFPFFFRFIMIPWNTFPEQTVFHISS